MQGKVPRLDQELLESFERQVAAPLSNRRNTLSKRSGDAGRPMPSSPLLSAARSSAPSSSESNFSKSRDACAPRFVLLRVERGGVLSRPEQGVVPQVEHAELRPAAEAEVVAVGKGMEVKVGVDSARARASGRAARASSIARVGQPLFPLAHPTSESMRTCPRSSTETMSSVHRSAQV